MSSEPIELARRAYGALDRREPDASPAPMHEQFEAESRLRHAPAENARMPGDRAIAVHGGAGGRAPADPAEEADIRQALSRAIGAGDAILASGGGALDAVVAAVVILEDAPQFNAGHGSVPTAEGAVEMDAGLMCGATLRAGAVALVTRPRNPVVVARSVLEEGRHVLLAGGHADEFAERRGAALEPPEYFLAPRVRGPVPAEEDRLGTVGAVARDRHGDLAAATSTGGACGQAAGRVGDSPIPGAGFYAANGRCAVSCTGGGEEIMRAVLAYRVAEALAAERSVRAAAEAAVGGTFAAIGGAGGLIAVDAEGDVGISFNTAVMHRAWKRGEAEARVAIA